MPPSPANIAQSIPLIMFKSGLGCWKRLESPTAPREEVEERFSARWFVKCDEIVSRDQESGECNHDACRSKG